MTISYPSVISKISSFKTTHHSSPVGVFVGGTSGICEHTLRAFIKHTTSPHAFIVGRNTANAERIIQELKSINGDAVIEWVKADVTLLSEVRRVCDVIKAKEKEVNLLVMTQSFSGMGGRNPSSENLDRKLTLINHSRLLFTHLLHPLLTHSPSHPSAVISVLMPGGEIPISLSNLTLKQGYSPSKCLGYATTMTSLSFYHLAGREEWQGKGVRFLQLNPGIVKTGVVRDFPWFVKPAMHLIFAVTSPWQLTPEETGERTLELGLGGRYPAAGEPPLSDETIGKNGSDEVVPKGLLGRSGVFAVGKHGEEIGKVDVLGKMVEEGYAEKVWEHNLSVFEEVEGKGRYEGKE